jgi:peptide/nickel transport system substrate-binding protein
MEEHLKKKMLFILVLTLSISMVLSACGTSATEVTEVTASEQTEALATEAVIADTEAAPEEMAETATTAVEGTGPTVGGTFRIASSAEPDTLDPALTSSGVSISILQFIGASLVWMNSDLTYEPYLAESWTVSDDGLIWDFRLRQDVKYPDGTPFTANDYAFTFTRALDPDVASSGTGSMLGNVTSVEAVDDYTLRFTLSAPYAPLLYSLCDTGYMLPINQTIFESIGADNFGRAPVSVGPFVFKEWVTGEKVVLERNPDFTWGPASWENQGPAYIQTLEFDIIPEYSTILAGLEAGEIDAASVEAQDVDRLVGTGSFDILTSRQQGISPYVSLNVSKAPFDDVRVRKAFNLAVDKDALLQVVLEGKGTVQYGFLSPVVMGYWPGIEDIGYRYDLEQAKSLMAEAGYTFNADGILEKDGQPLSLTMEVDTYTTRNVKAALVLVEQYADLGVEVTIEQLETNIFYDKVMSGDYQLAIAGLGYGDADLMYLAFHSSMIGACCNFSYLNDPDLDALLEASRTTSDPTERQEVLNQLQQTILEQAYIVPLITPERYRAINNRWQGVKYSDALINLQLSDANLVP